MCIAFWCNAAKTGGANRLERCRWQEREECRPTPLAAFANSPPSVSHPFTLQSGFADRFASLLFMAARNCSGEGVANTILLGLRAFSLISFFKGLFVCFLLRSLIPFRRSARKISSFEAKLLLENSADLFGQFQLYLFILECFSIPRWSSRLGRTIYDRDLRDSNGNLEKIRYFFSFPTYDVINTRRIWISEQQSYYRIAPLLTEFSISYSSLDRTD